MTTTCSLAPNPMTTNTTPELPPLPHIPEALYSGPAPLSRDQQAANLLHVAKWIVSHPADLYMDWWHAGWDPDDMPYSQRTRHNCGTAHCIAGFAQIMAGDVGFSLPDPAAVGGYLLGMEAYRHFGNDNATALLFLEEVITRNA